MKKNTCVIICIYLFLQSCNISNNRYSNVRNDTVKFTLRTMGGEIEREGIELFKKISHKETVEFRYYIPSIIDSITKDTAFNSYTIFKNSDSLLLFGDDTCFLLDSKRFLIDNKFYQINKYFMNQENVIDEESEILFNDSVGIIQEYPLNWNFYATHIMDTLSQKLNDALLMDTSLFVKRINNKNKYHNILSNQLNKLRRTN